MPVPPSVVDGDALPGDLVEAIVARLQAALVAPGLISWAGTGPASPGVPLPYVSVGDLDEQADYQENGDGSPAPFDDEGTVPVACFAAAERDCKALSRLVARTLSDSRLRFADGDLLMLRRVGRTAPAPDPDPAPGGGDCWAAHLIFASITSKTL